MRSFQAVSEKAARAALSGSAGTGRRSGAFMADSVGDRGGSQRPGPRVADATLRAGWRVQGRPRILRLSRRAMPAAPTASKPRNSRSAGFRPRRAARGVAPAQTTSDTPRAGASARFRYECGRWPGNASVSPGVEHVQLAGHHQRDAAVQAGEVLARGRQVRRAGHHGADAQRHQLHLLVGHRLGHQRAHDDVAALVLRGELRGAPQPHGRARRGEQLVERRGQRLRHLQQRLQRRIAGARLEARDRRPRHARGGGQVLLRQAARVAQRGDVAREVGRGVGRDRGRGHGAIVARRGRVRQTNHRPAGRARVSSRGAAGAETGVTRNRTRSPP